MDYGRLAKIMLAGSAASIMDADEASALNLGPLAKKFKPQFSSLMDQKPRMEIDDSKSRILTGKLDTISSRDGTVYTEGIHQPLSKLFHHPELYANYPELAEYPTRIAITPGMKGSSGGFSEGKWGSISVHAGDLEEAKKTLLHEIQHAIQEKEGFARGGDTQQILRQRVQGINEWLEAKKKSTDPEEIAAIDELLKKFQEDPYKTYLRLAGEIESRDVAARAGLSAEQRLSTPHYSPQGIPLDDVITRYRAMGAAQALQEPWLDPVSMFTSTVGIPRMAGKMAAMLMDPAINYVSQFQMQPKRVQDVFIGP